jgi:hypothetical protein
MGCLAAPSPGPRRLGGRIERRKGGDTAADAASCNRTRSGAEALSWKPGFRVHRTRLWRRCRAACRSRPDPPWAAGSRRRGTDRLVAHTPGPASQAASRRRTRGSSGGLDRRRASRVVWPFDRGGDFPSIPWVRLRVDGGASTGCFPGFTRGALVRDCRGPVAHGRRRPRPSSLRRPPLSHSRGPLTQSADSSLCRTVDLTAARRCHRVLSPRPLSGTTTRRPAGGEKGAV